MRALGLGWRTARPELFWTPGDELDHVADTRPEDGEIHDDEDGKHCRQRERGVVRHGIVGPHYAMNDPRLASDLGRKPPRQDRDKAGGTHQYCEAKQEFRL